LPFAFYPFLFFLADDETDYFSSETNSWLSAKEKDALRAKEEELKRLREEKEKAFKFTLDFAGRKVIEANDAHEGAFPS